MNEDVKFSISGEDKSWQQTLDRTVKSTDRATQKMSASFSKMEQAQNRAVSRRTGSHAAGMVAMQAQDVAVQLQGGAKAATVLAQQGSQIASAFGPGGAIVGGVLAIGAALYSAATGAKKLKDNSEDAKAATDFNKQSLQLMDLATVMRVRVNLGEDAAKETERELRFERELAELNRKEAGASQAQLAERRKALESIYKSEQDIVAQHAKDEYYKAVVQESDKVIQLQRELGDMQLSDEGKRAQLLDEISDLAREAYATGKSALATETAKAKLLEKQLELSRLTVKANADLIQKQEDADKAREKAQDAAQDRLQAFADGWARTWGKVGEAINKAAKAAEDMREQSAQKGLAAFNQRVAARRQSPQEKAEARREERSQARAQREVIRRDLKGTVQRDPMTGRITKFENLGGASRDKLIRDRMGAINRANEQGVTNLSAETIRQLAAAIGVEVLKPIPK